MNCISLIEAPITLAEMSQWTFVSDLQNVIDTQQLENVALLSNQITADKLTFEDIDCTQIGAIVLHECGNDDSQIISFQSPPEGIVQVGNDVCLVLCGFCLVDECCDVPDEEQKCLDYACESPCERWIRLRCCYDQLICGQNVVRVEYEDRSVTYTKGNITCLKQEVNKAYIECQSTQCQNTPRRFVFNC